MDASELNSIDDEQQLPDLRAALRQSMGAYWRRVATTLEGEPEAEIIEAGRVRLDRSFLDDIARAQGNARFDLDPLNNVVLTPELSIGIDALSQRAVRQWKSIAGCPASVAIFVCRSFMRHLIDNVEVSSQIQLGLVKMFGRLVIDPFGSALSNQPGMGLSETQLEQPHRALKVALTMMHSELVQALNSGTPAPECSTLDKLLDSIAQRILEVTGQLVEVSELAPEAIAHLSALFAPILDDQQLDQTSQHLLATLMIPSLKLGIDDPDVLGQPGRLTHDLIKVLHERATVVRAGTDEHRDLLTTIQGILLDFRDDERAFVTTLVNLKADGARTRRRAEFSQRQATRVAESKVRLDQAQQQARDAVAEKLTAAGTRLPELLQQTIEIDWTNWLTLVVLRHGTKSTEWQENLAFVDDLIWSGEAKLNVADVARLQSTLPAISTRLHQGLEMVGYGEQDRKTFFNALRKTYQRLVRREFRNQLHIPAVHTKFKPRPIMIPVHLNTKDAQAVSTLIRRLKSGTWFEFLTDKNSFVRVKLSWVSPISDRFLFVDKNGLKLADKTQQQLRTDLTRGTARVLGMPA